MTNADLERMAMSIADLAEAESGRWDLLEKRIIKALRTVRNETLEEAAKVAGKYIYFEARNSGINEEEHEISKAIRSLKEPQ